MPLIRVDKSADKSMGALWHDLAHVDLQQIPGDATLRCR
jgi:hypothetical protein